MIAKTASACRKCGRGVEPAVVDEGEANATVVERMMLPVGRPGSAIAAGYLGLFSVLPFFGIVAIVVSLLALRTLRRNPKLSGRGRAYFGLIMGSLMTLLYAVPIVLALAASLKAP